MTERRIYLDNAATTKVDSCVVEAMLPYFTEKFGNPSGIYRIGSEVRAAIEEARFTISSFFNAKATDIYFTSNATEADNWVLKSYALANRHRGNHIITSKIEHHAVLRSCEWLETQGFKITYLPVDEYGVVDAYAFEKAITEQTILASIMMANNEIGTIQPIEQLAKIARKKRVFFHTDAVQAVGTMPIDVQELGIDAFSMSAHKIHGPKGIGLLFVRAEANLPPLHHGGGQERSKRAGTENVAGIVGLAKALEIVDASRKQRVQKMAFLRDCMQEGVLARIPHVRVNGHPKRRLPNHLSLCFRDVKSEPLLMLLDMQGIVASGGAACAAGSIEPSHVLLALGLSKEWASGALRLTFSAENTEDEVRVVIARLEEIVSELRKSSV